MASSISYDQVLRDAIRELDFAGKAALSDRLVIVLQNVQRLVWTAEQANFEEANSDTSDLGLALKALGVLA